MSGKYIETVAAPAIYKGDHRVAAGQAKGRIPDDPEAVIARNTVKTVKTDMEGECCPTMPNDADKYRK